MSIRSRWYLYNFFNINCVSIDKTWLALNFNPWTLTLPSTYFDSCHWYIVKKAVHYIIKHHHEAKKKFKALFTSKSAARDSLSSSSLGTSSPKISLSWLIHKWSCSWSSTNGLGTSSEESESVSDSFTALCDKEEKRYGQMVRFYNVY